MNHETSYERSLLNANMREKTKGGLGGFCALTTCRTKPALFLQRTNGKYYCALCAIQIQRFRSRLKKETDMVRVLTQVDYDKLVRMEQAIIETLKK